MATATRATHATPHRNPATLAVLAALGLATAGLMGGLVGACTPGDGAPPQIALARPPEPGTCAEWTGQPVERSCLPRTAMASVPLVLEIEERCGACGTTAERCTVSVEGRVVNLSLDGKTCEPPVGVACQEACAKHRIKCKVPPLDEGRYMVRYGDPGGRVDSFDVVPRRDAPTSCSLDDVGGGGAGSGATDVTPPG